jgi:large subunit ribosomal protein L4
MLLDIYKKDGTQAGQFEVSDDIFGCEPNETAMHQAVITYLANQRQGTHKTKTRAQVSGGGKKPWRQKGRGTARSGSSRSPLWVGGGTVHGPFPHKYNLKMPKKMKQLARKSALSLRASEKNIVLVEDINMSAIKTKEFAQILKNLKIYGEKTLVFLPEDNKVIYMSARNIDRLDIYPAELISTYDILCHKKLLIFKGAVEKIQNALNN